MGISCKKTLVNSLGIPLLALLNTAGVWTALVREASFLAYPPILSLDDLADSRMLTRQEGHGDRVSIGLA